MLQFDQTLPCGLRVTVAETPATWHEHGGEFLFSVETEDKVHVRAYAPSYRAALVRVRFAVESVLRQSADESARLIGEALRNAAH